MNQSSISAIDAARSIEEIPRLTALVVDLDGTLTPTDTLVESVIQMVRRNPASALKLPLWLLKGRAAFKSKVASKSGFSAKSLPYRQALLDYLRAEKNKGRCLILATAAHDSIGGSVAEHLGLFEKVLASDAKTNLKGKEKLEAIKRHAGEEFCYVGDSAADLPIWEAAKAAILVNVPDRMAARVRGSTPIEHEFPPMPVRTSIWLKAFRVHQWLKNLLLFVPLLTAFSLFDPDKITTIALAFIAFSLAASATYIVNDLLDLESDRAHPRKRFRPFANGDIPILHGLVAGLLSLAVALSFAASISPQFLAILALYLFLTSAYSWILKEYVLIDVLMLSVLYTLRIFAGSIAAGIAVSSWLLAFSLFIFLSLALVKRSSELISLEQIGRIATRGRDYRVSDLAVLWPLGVGASLSAVVVFGLFINAPETRERYESPQMLWLVAILLIYWIARLWIKTARGEMHDDPVVYAIRNFGSLVTILAMTAVALVAHFISMDLP